MKAVAASLVIVATLASSQVNAEWADEHTVWRIQGGLNSSTFAGNDADRGDLERRQAVVLGVSSLVHVSRLLGIEFGAFYSQKGTKGRVEETADFDIPLVSGAVDGTAKFHYIEIPLMLSFTIPVNQRVATRLYAGPAMALLSSAVIESDASAIVGASGTESVDIASWTQNLDVVGIIGAAAAVETGPVNLILGFRWARGLRSVDDADLSLDVFNSSLSLLAGIEIPTFRSRNDGGDGVFQ